jgi:predicted GNAT family N-acyltransferase
MHLEWQVKHYPELSTNEFHDIIALRLKAFVVEQNCSYLDLMKQAMKFAAEEFGNVPIRISAQKHLENYYQHHGFESTGKEYLEDEIPHVEMLYTPSN